MSSLSNNSEIAPAESSSSYGRCPECGCVGPNPGYNALTEDEVNIEMKKISPYWILSDDKKQLKREFTCRNWQSAIQYINKASEIAESVNIEHHPDIHLTKYRNIEVVLWTHAAGGLTVYDFKLAVGLDTIEIDYSPKWLASHKIE